MATVIKALAFLGILLIIGANEFELRSLFALSFIPLFFIGKPWYKYLSKKLIWEEKE